jgi:hypothetical protein
VRSIRIALLALLIGAGQSALPQMELSFGHVGEPGMGLVDFFYH